MKGSVHLYVSGALGAILYKLSHSAGISIMTFLSGVLIDIDHVFDFWILSGKKFSWIRQIFELSHKHSMLEEQIVEKNQNIIIE